MVKCNTAREAITLLCEQELKLQNYSEAEVKFLKSKIKSYMDFLTDTVGWSKEAVIERIQGFRDEDMALLTSNDIYADHIWSRGEEVGDLEIDAAKYISEDIEGQANLEHQSHKNYWEKMENIAESASEGYLPEVWHRSESKMNDIMECLNRYQAAMGDIIPKGHLRSYLLKTKNRINELRFGKAIRKGKITIIIGGNELVYRHWAICFNAINKMLGIDKVIVLKEIEQSEDGDALDYATYVGDDPSTSSEEADVLSDVD